MRSSIAALGFLMIGALACVDSKPAQTDTAGALPEPGRVMPLDTAIVDSTVAAPAAPSSQPPSAIGEGTRENPPASRDPMPPLTGETSKQGGTMPVYRDSTSGPRMEIDSKGRVTPIKK
jgi:hypothetical protein